MRDAGTRVDAREEDSYRLPSRGIDETVRVGREIYERDIRHKVEKDHVGKVVAIDVDTGYWALGDDTVLPDKDVAGERLKEKQPDAINILCERVGFRALWGFGAGSLRIAQGE